LISELYTIHLLVWYREFQRLYFSQQTGVSFQVRHPLFTTHFGIFHEPGQWVWKPGEETAPVTLLQQGIE
jgi:hypothetical protein